MRPEMRGHFWCNVVFGRFRSLRTRSDSGIPCSLIVLFLTVGWVAESHCAGWCGESKKQNCGFWTIQMSGYEGGVSSDDCVTYSGCLDSASWVYSPGSWNQLMVSKNGFCGKNYSIDNTASFEVSYDGSFAKTRGATRLCIVSWAKSTDDCNWVMKNTWELYIHEQSVGESDTYAQWCGKYVGSAHCSGSEYRMYNCGDNAIDGQWALRCWRQSPRRKGVTDIQCLWKWWRSRGIPNLYYYITEVGAEQGPGTRGTFTLRNPDMVRTGKPGAGDVGSVVAPDAVEAGETVTVSVTYSASANSDLYVLFQKNTAPWTAYATEQVDIPAGDNKTVEIPVTIPTTTPHALGAYQWQVFLTNDGGDWSSRIDNVEKTEIDCSPSNIGVLTGSENQKRIYRMSHGQAEPASLSIIDISGRTIFTGAIDHAGEKVRVPELRAGAYVVEIGGGTCSEMSRMIVNQ